MIWEQDELFFSVIVSVISIFIMFISSIPAFLMVFFLIGIVYVTNFFYRRLVKESAPGYLMHFFYNLGLYDPNGKADSDGEKDTFLPYGFEREFRN